MGGEQFFYKQHVHSKCLWKIISIVSKQFIFLKMITSKTRRNGPVFYGQFIFFIAFFFFFSLAYSASSHLTRLAGNAMLCFGLHCVLKCITKSVFSQTAERMNTAEIKCSDSSQHFSVTGEITVNSFVCIIGLMNVLKKNKK